MSCPFVPPKILNELDLTVQPATCYLLTQISDISGGPTGPITIVELQKLILYFIYHGLVLLQLFHVYATVKQSKDRVVKEGETKNWRLEGFSTT